MMKKSILYILISLSMVKLVSAQDTLLTSYRTKVLSYNKDMVAVYKGVDISEEMAKKSKADRLPKLAAGAYYNYIGNPTELQLALPTLDQPLQMKGNEINYGATLNLQQAIYAGGKINLAVGRSKIEGEIANKNVEVVQSDVILSSDVSYWTYVAQTELTIVMKDYADAVDQLVSKIEERVEAELISRSDLLMAQVKQNEAKYRLLQATTLEEKSRLSLNSFAGVPYDEVIVVDQIIPLAYATNLNEVQRAEEIIAERKIELQRVDGKLQDTKYRPQLLMGAEGSYSTPGYDFHEDLDPNYKVYAKLSVPIWEWRKRGKDKRISSLKVELAENQKEKLIDALSLEQAMAKLQFHQALEQCTLTETSLVKAKQNEEMANDNYLEGRISIVELLDAQLFQQQAQINFVQAKLQAQVQRSIYLRALGAFQ